MKYALFLYERSGETARPWAEAGYQCLCVDICHSVRSERSDGNIRFIYGDARSWCPPSGVRFSFAMAMPPCTHVAGSGAQDWRRKANYLLTDALEHFASSEMALSYAGCPYAIENPVGALSRHMRKPDYIFNPCDFAGYADDPQSEAYTKKTCLWTGGGFVMPDKKFVTPDLGSKMHLLTPSDDRADTRSKTPSGLARAVFMANSRVTQQ